MGLKHIKLPEARIELPGGEFTVRGLSLDDIAFLVQRHGDKFGSLLSDFQNRGGELTPESIAQFAGPLLQSAPEIAAQLIACASGDPDDAPIAAALPFPVQIDALEKLAKLTFDAGGGPKKLFETIISMLQGMTSLLDNLRA